MGHKLNRLLISHWWPSRAFLTTGKVADKQQFGIDNFVFPVFALLACAVLPLLWSTLPG